jgi:cell wall-associated NlpC family hydrolase
LEGREFVHGVHDCYAIVRDYYHQLNIELQDYPRQGEWWLQGQALYRNNFAAEGFVEVPWETMRPHDVLLMRVRSQEVENHAAIYLGNNVILHHLMNSLSCKSHYEAYWQRHTTAVLRHRSFL